MEDEEEGGGEHESFKRLWRNERCAPALLPFDEELVRTIELQIQAQVCGRALLESVASVCHARAAL